ncbi:hypothetical protein FG386_002992 [Cryptosporidium ryanae]|uniref:uncharacterized protein n=1 Tax=Cryptosporidium ryanae TaxID=515981 RepID=UPI00351A03AC|nr:hypothetical protein FG386_002992 [Cryptosporidium ryanae]
MKDVTSVIKLGSRFFSICESKSFNKSEFSQFWLVNTILNSLYSINNNKNPNLRINEYFKGSVFEEIRTQLDIIVNNIELVKLNERDNTIKSLIWNELGNCVTVYIIELIEKWNTKVCELQNNHLNNCEVTFDALVPDFIEFQNKKSTTTVTNNVVGKDNLWDDDKFWEIDSSYPFREFKFGIKESTGENSDESDSVYSNHITIICLSNIMRPYLYIWKNIRLFLNKLVRIIFLSGEINSTNVDHYKSELNIYILDLLFRNLEKSLLLLDENMISIWISLLRRCVDLFANIIPKNTPMTILSLFHRDYNLNLVNILNEYHEFVRILYDLSSSLNSRVDFNDNIMLKMKSIGELLGVNDNKSEIAASDIYISNIKYVNYNTDKPIDIIMDVDIKKKMEIYHPFLTLYTLKKKNNKFLRYTYNNMFGDAIKYKKNELKKYYKMLFIKNTGKTEINNDNEYRLKLVNDMNRIRIIDILRCLKDFVILEDSYTEHLFRALYIDSKKMQPNIDVDPTEVNLSIKLLGKKDIISSNSKNNSDSKTEYDYSKIRKIMSILLLEFDVGNLKEHVKEQLPTYHSLKIKLNIPSENVISNYNNFNHNHNGDNKGGGDCNDFNSNIRSNAVNLNTHGLPNYIISEFLSDKVMEKYSSVFTFLLEVKRSTIFLNQVFQTLLSVKRDRNRLFLCKQRFRNNGHHHINSNNFCDNSCTVILNWIDNIYTRCYKIRYSIQLIIDIYTCCISMYMPIIWEELETSLNEKNSLNSMVKSHREFISKFHRLTLSPNRTKDNKTDNIALDEEFQVISANIVFILKLGRSINIIVYKFDQLIRFLINANNTMKEKRYIPCGLVKRKIEDIYKRITMSLDLLFSNYSEYKRQFIDSIDKYYSDNKKISNFNDNLSFISLQLRSSIY